ncbi:MAG: hypothetical protein Q9M48_12415 [Rhodobacterales bacterium]|nr:hypothetical protein [Rhodobacterales bacterium]
MIHSKPIRAAFLATMAMIIFTTPASAGGNFSVSFNAQNNEEAAAIRTGLVFYRVVKDIKSNGHITQNGIGNLASLSQNGSGNIGLIQQEGNNHNASLDQTGDNNSFGIFQFGENTDGQVTQTGYGGAGLLFLIGF